MSALPPLRFSIDVESEEQRIELMHAISAAVRKIQSPDHVDPAEKYWDPLFAQHLLEHMNQAQRKALAGYPR